MQQAQHHVRVLPPEAAPDEAQWCVMMNNIISICIKAMSFYTFFLDLN
jgi:hypothetical protein